MAVGTRAKVLPRVSNGPKLHYDNLWGSHLASQSFKEALWKLDESIDVLTLGGNISHNWEEKNHVQMPVVILTIVMVDNKDASKKKSPKKMIWCTGWVPWWRGSTTTGYGD